MPAPAARALNIASSTRSHSSAATRSASAPGVPRASRGASSSVNPIEAVKLGAAIVHGPHVFNFTDVYEALDQSGGARRVDDQQAVVKQLGQLLANPDSRDAMVAASAQVVDDLGGALERTLTALEPYLLQVRLEMGAANA